MFNNRRKRNIYVPITPRHIAKFARMVEEAKQKIKDPQPKLKLK